MRSCSMALQLLSVAIGSYLSGALVYVVGAYTQGVAGAKHGWLPDDLNKGRVDLFFLLLAGEPRSPTVRHHQCHHPCARRSPYQPIPYCDATSAKQFRMLVDPVQF